MKKNTKKKGFTLIELIVVIAILGILAAVLIPKFTGFQDKARQTQALTDAKQVATAIDSLYAQNNAWPAIADVVKLSGVPESEITLDANGGFTVKVHVGTSDYYAYRTDGSADGTTLPGKVMVTP